MKTVSPKYQLGTSVKNSVAEVICDYLRYLEQIKGAPAKTVENYTHYLKRFGEYVGDRTPESLIFDDIEKYRLFLTNIKNLINDQPLSIRTINYHIIVLRSFFKYCFKKGINTLKADQIETTREPDRIADYLEIKEIEKLFGTINVHDVWSLRDRTIMEFLYSTGLRIGELIKLNRENIDLTHREFQIVGKGGKRRIVFMNQRGAYWVEAYLKLREDNLPPLFINQLNTHNKGRRLSAVTIQSIVRKCAKKAKINKEVTVHTLRHSFATNLLQNGADIRAIQLLLGHAHIATTQLYLHITDKHLKEAYNRYNP